MSLLAFSIIPISTVDAWRGGVRARQAFELSVRRAFPTTMEQLDTRVHELARRQRAMENVVMPVVNMVGLAPTIPDGIRQTLGWVPLVADNGALAMPPSQVVGNSTGGAGAFTTVPGHSADHQYGSGDSSSIMGGGPLLMPPPSYHDHTSVSGSIGERDVAAPPLLPPLASSSNITLPADPVPLPPPPPPTLGSTAESSSSSDMASILI